MYVCVCVCVPYMKTIMYSEVQNTALMANSKKRRTTKIPRLSDIRSPRSDFHFIPAKQTGIHQRRTQKCGLGGGKMLVFIMAASGTQPEV